MMFKFEFRDTGWWYWLPAAGCRHNGQSDVRLLLSGALPDVDAIQPDKQPECETGQGSVSDTNGARQYCAEPAVTALKPYFNQKNGARVSA